jgi:hypothetical protein
VLVSLVEDCPAELVLLSSGQHPHHPGDSGLHEPDGFVEVVPRDLLGLGHDKDGLVVSSINRSLGAAVLAWGHREVGVGVGKGIVGLDNLVDDDEW